MTLPTFLVIGAMKSGTTSLHADLAAHPEVFVSRPKELDFFVAERAWDRGVDWYESCFASSGAAVAVGEASPNYTKDPLFAGVPGRIRSVVPEVRLVYVVRHPVERMVSHYAHDVAAHGARAPIGEALLAEPHFRLCSSYAHQLDRYLDAGFDRSQLLVLTAESLRDDRPAQLARLFAFLGVDAEWRPPVTAPRLHRTESKRVPRALLRRRPALRRVVEGRAPRLAGRTLRPDELTVPPAVEAELVAALRPDVTRLRTWLGEDFDGWGLLEP